MAMREIDNILETDIKIEGKDIDNSDVKLLWAKEQLIFRNLAEFWTPLIRTGKTCFDYMHGKIFDDRTRAQYENVQQKIVIEPRLMKPRINSLVGTIMQARRSGKIITEGGMSADQVATANLILKYFENKIKEQELLETMLFNGLVSCMPQVLWFDYAKTVSGDQMAGLYAEVLDWDSFLLNKYYHDPAGEDVTQIIRVARKTKNELKDENPNRVDAIDEHYIRMNKGDNANELDEEITGMTAQDARYLYYDVITGNSHNTIDGRCLCFERLCPVKENMEVAIKLSVDGESTNDTQYRPGTWSDERWTKWKKDNSNDYMVVNQKVNALWQVRWTREGLMLQNKLHWFQEHDDRAHPILPIGVFTPQIIDGIPSGPGIDMKHKILMKAIAEIEWLHNIRTGSGDVLAYRAGSVKNFEDLSTELSIGNGIIQLDSAIAGKIRDNIDFLKRNPNTTYEKYSEKVSRDLEGEDLVNKGLLGLHAQDQSGKAKDIEIAQAVIGYSIVAANYNKSYMRVKNLECMLIPYIFTEEQVIELQDDEQQDLPKVTVNQEEADLAGNVSSVTNDLSSVKWRWMLVPGDDSPTARQAELKEMLIFWNTTAPALIETDETLGVLSSVLMSMSNKTAKETGKVIAEKAQVRAQQMNQQQMAQLMAELEERKAKTEAEKIKAMRAGFSFSITPEDLAYIPGMYDLLVGGNYINTGENNQFQLPEQAGQPAETAA